MASSNTFAYLAVDTDANDAEFSAVKSVKKITAEKKQQRQEAFKQKEARNAEYREALNHCNQHHFAGTASCGMTCKLKALVERHCAEKYGRPIGWEAMDLIALEISLNAHEVTYCSHTRKYFDKNECPLLQTLRTLNSQTPTTGNKSYGKTLRTNAITTDELHRACNLHKSTPHHGDEEFNKMMAEKRQKEKEEREKERRAKKEETPTGIHHDQPTNIPTEPASKREHNDSLRIKCERIEREKEVVMAENQTLFTEIGTLKESLKQANKSIDKYRRLAEEDGNAIMKWRSAYNNLGCDITDTIREGGDADAILGKIKKILGMG